MRVLSPLSTWALPRRAKFTTAIALIVASLTISALTSVQGMEQEPNLSKTSNAKEVVVPIKVPIKEIESVEIVNGETPLIRNTGNVFVVFSHRGKRRGKSLPFKDDGDGNDLRSSWVNLPLLADAEGKHESVKCEIKKKLKFRRDKTLFIADVVLRDEPEITSAIRDLKGRDTGARIKLRFFVTEWIVDGSFDGGVNPPKKMDLYFTVFVKALQFLAPTFFPGKITDMEKPSKAADPNLKTVTLLDGLIEYPKRDEFVPTLRVVKYIAPLLNRFFLLTDRNNPVGDRTSLRNDIRVKKLKNYVNEPIEGRWVAPLTDASMHRVFFSGLGMAHIEKVSHNEQYNSENEYVSDMMIFKELSYRKDWDNLGCSVFFDPEANISMIKDHDDSVYFPGDKLWEWAKQKARTASFLLTSLEHLVHYHLNWANVPGMALRMFLAHDHPVRVAFTPHFYKSHNTCYLSKSLLLDRRGPLRRVLPFEYEGGFKKLVVDLMNNFQFRTFPDELEQKGLTDCDFHIGATDGLGLHKIMIDYVSNLFDEIYPTMESLHTDDDMRKLYAYLSEKLKGVPSEFSMANLKMVWGEVLFRVTGGHSAFGNVRIYALEPFMINFRMREEDKGKVVGNRETISTVGVITGLTSPDEFPHLSSDWTHLMHNSNSTAYAQLDSDLFKLGEKIDKSNNGTVRRFVNKDYHPGHAAISVFS